MATGSKPCYRHSSRLIHSRIRSIETVRGPCRARPLRSQTRPRAAAEALLPQAADLSNWLLENGGSINGVELSYEYGDGVVLNRELRSTRVSTLN
jgi:hypothetical protein